MSDDSTPADKTTPDKKPRAAQPVVAAARRRRARGPAARPVGLAGRHPRPRAAHHRARVRPLHRRQVVRHARREVLRRLPAGGAAAHLGRDGVRHRHHPAGRLLQDQRHDARGRGPRGHRRPRLLQEGDLEAQRHDRRRPAHELRRGGRHPHPLHRHPGRAQGDAHAGGGRDGGAGGRRRPRGRRHASPAPTGRSGRPGTRRPPTSAPTPARRSRSATGPRPAVPSAPSRSPSSENPQAPGQRLPRRARRGHPRQAGPCRGGAAGRQRLQGRRRRDLHRLLVADQRQDQRDGARRRRGAGRHHRRQPPGGRSRAGTRSCSPSSASTWGSSTCCRSCPSTAGTSP